MSQALLESSQIKRKVIYTILSSFFRDLFQSNLFYASRYYWYAGCVLAKAELCECSWYSTVLNEVVLPLVDIVLQSTNFFAYSGRLCMTLLSLCNCLSNSFRLQNQSSRYSFRLIVSCFPCWVLKSLPSQSIWSFTVFSSCLNLKGQNQTKLSQSSGKITIFRKMYDVWQCALFYPLAAISNAVIVSVCGSSNGCGYWWLLWVF